MQFTQTLGQQLAQRMSQSQIQSLDLLAMPAAELKEKIAAELAENPALERAADMLQFDPPYPEKNAADSRRGIYRPELPYNQYGSAHAAEKSDAFQAFLENIPADQYKTLQEHLLDQLYVYPLDKQMSRYAERIIGNLDADGFHIVPFAELFQEELTAEAEAGAVRGKIRHTLSLIRRFDPIGCAVRDFKQSLIIQAKILFSAKASVDPVYGYTIDILEHHFPYLEKARPYALVNAVNGNPAIPYKITQKNAEDIFSLITLLNPFPGRAFGSEPAADEYIIPTAIVEREGNEFSVKINTFELPLLTVSPEFQKLAKDADDAAAKDYIQKQIRRAKVFIGSLTQREKTIVAVLRTIVAVQEAFFLSGDKRQLVPLTQQQIAEKLGVHESTVSRTVSGKYVQCPWGLFEMKYFFTNSLPVQLEQGAAVNMPNTKEGVKACIQELLADQSGRLSDQKISDILSKQYGISVARRTVAKYRKELAIASSYDRP